MATAPRGQGNMAMKSHYASFPLSEACRNDLRALQEALFNDAKQLNLRSSGPGSFQLTLSVFKIDKSKRNETEKELIESVNKILKDFLDKRPPLELTFGSLGSFGPRLVFITVTNVKELEDLRQDMNDRLKEEGIYVADERFTPHVTLFRAGHYGGGRNSDDSGSKPTVEDMVKRTDLPPVSPSPVKEIVFKRLLGA